MDGVERPTRCGGTEVRLLGRACGEIQMTDPNHETEAECDIDGCEREAVADNGVGGRLCSYHI